jgi:regulator of cell morphogenesis and NO signaling
MNIQINQITPNTKMSDLIYADYRLLLTINRFNIPLGFGDKTISELCLLYHVDMECFLSITRFLIFPESFDVKDFMNINAISVLKYLKNSHIYFLEKRLNDLRERLRTIYTNMDSIPSKVILNFFDNYYKEIQEHMGYENEIVFPYIENLWSETKTAGFTIDEFETHHSNIQEKLTDLKNLMIKYIEPVADNYQTTNILFDIFLTEQDLNTHSFIEDHILVPIVRKKEKELK